MCLILIAYKSHPGYPLILAANRDEFYARPTEPLALRGPGRDMLCGLDLEGGGTWLAAGRGRIAALTNVREPGRVKAGAPSRGLLVSGCIGSAQPLDQFMEDLLRQPAEHNGFNLIAADSAGLYYCSNRFGGAVRLSAGLYGLCNHRLDTPWPKVTRAKKLFADALAAHDEPDIEALFAVVRDDTQPPDAELPYTGVGPEWERILAPIFIRSPIYGTRTSSLLLLDKNARLRFIERTHGLPGSPDRPGTREFFLSMQPVHRMPGHAQR